MHHTFQLLAPGQVQGRQWEVAKHLDVSFRRWCVCEWGRTEKLRRFMISGEVLRVRRWAIRQNTQESNLTSDVAH